MGQQIVDYEMSEKIFLTYTNATAVPYQGSVRRRNYGYVKQNLRHPYSVNNKQGRCHTE